MKSIRIISRISAVLLVILGVINLYDIILWYNNNPLSNLEHKTSIIVSSFLLCGGAIFEIMVFAALFTKSKKKTTVRRDSLIALVGLFLCFMGTLAVNIPFFLQMESTINVPNWSVVWSYAVFVGCIVLSIAVLYFIYDFYSIKTLSFWGGILFVIGVIVKDLFCVINMLFKLNDVGNIDYFMTYCLLQSILSTVSDLGMALFFYGLTSNNKRNG